MSEQANKPRTAVSDSGVKYEVEEYTKNEGSVGRKKITFVGASYKFVHKVLRDMMLVGGFDECELCVHDLNPEPIRTVGDLLEKMARQKNTKIEVTRTTELDAALKGADIVILSITTGGQESDYRGFEVCLKYGIPVGVGDTLGPPALARNLRTIPVVLALAKRMEALCPDAVMLNFTNPMSVLTGCMARHSSITTWGLCHSADELFRYFSRVFECGKQDIDLEIGGVNHQAFVTRVSAKGVDRTSEILDATLKSKAKLEDNLLNTVQEEVNLQQDIFRVLGAWPSTGYTHLAEFYEYFFTERRLNLFHSHSLKSIIPGRKPFGPKEPPAIIEKWAHGPEPVGDLELLTTEHAHELMWSVFTGDAFTRVLNVPNTGELVKGIPEDACVEALVTVEGTKVSGTPMRLPAAAHSLVQRWTTIHDLSVHAAMEHDRDAARQALFLDPHVRDMYDIDPLLEDLLEATREWLPSEWFKG